MMRRRRSTVARVCRLVLLLPLVAVATAQAEPPLQALALQAGTDQGVFVQAEDGTVLVSQNADTPVHPASVTKVATSLALLEKLGPDYRFETRLLAGGPTRDGVVQGDLIVQADRDPFLVYENAFLMLAHLRELGIHGVRGDLVVRGGLLFNWQPDPDGRRFRATLMGQDGKAAWGVVAAKASAGVPATLAGAALQFAHQPVTDEADPPVLATHRSPPLIHVVKALNGYSNNVFHLVSDKIGGPEAVEAIARAHVPPDVRDEILITNGAGGGTTNRISPRAAVAILNALRAELRGHGLGLTDALPVSGYDPGTLEHRLIDASGRRGIVVGKTGTFGSVGASALAGVLRTTRYGDVTFAVLNSWLPVPAAREHQDHFVRALAAATDAQPWSYDHPTRPSYLSAVVE